MREMKESGLEWIKKIPKEWEVNRIKYLFKSSKGLSITKENLIEEGLPVISYGQIHSKMNTGVTVDDDLCRFVSYDYSKYKSSKIEKFDFAFADTSEDYEGCGNCVYKRTDDELYGGYHVVILKSVNKKDNRYFAYLFQTDAWRAQIRTKVSGVKVYSITQKIINEASVIIPPVQEQKRIANFLDVKCTEIDELAADIQAQIETLEQYKRSIISETVAKGLNPNVQMKDSGIEWIGEIPATWNIHPVYGYFGERKNKNSLGHENNLLSLSYGRVIRKDINANGGLLPESFNTYNIVEAGDIIIRPTDLQNDKRSLRTGLVKEHGIITSAYIDLCPIKHVDSRYFHYLLHSYDVMKVFYNMGNGVRQGLNYSEFSKLMVFEPIYAEQVSIANYLDKKCSEIKACIDGKQRQLKVLDEYKKSLIYEYVTGKKEVPAIWSD